MKKAHLIIDIGTGNSRAGVISTEGELLSVATRDSVYYTDTDFADSIYFKPEEWKLTLKELVKEAIAGAGNVKILAVSASSQRQGIVLISEAGESLVGFQNGDNRGAAYLDEIDWAPVKELTGLEPMPLYSCVKFLGTMRKQPYVAEKTKVYTSISDWVGFCFTGKVVWERSQAIQTAVYDVAKREWSERLCRAVGVERCKLPPIVSAGSVLGKVKPALADELGLPRSTVFVVGAADTQIALTGSGARLNEVTIVSGTTTPVVKIKDVFRFYPVWNSPHAIDGQYMLECNAASTGINLQRFKDLMLPDRSYAELIAEAKQRKVPRCMAMMGMCPHNGDVPPLNGGFLMSNPISHELTQADFFHALSLDIAMSIVLCIKRINALDAYDRDYVVGCGGGLRSELICQAIADLSGFKIQIFRGFDQATMMGCMYLCNDALGVPSQPRELIRTVEPHDNPELGAYFARWQKLRSVLTEMN